MTQPRLELEVACPANESEEHFRLKHFVRRWLKERRAKGVAIEAGFCKPPHAPHYAWPDAYVDCLAVMESYVALGKDPIPPEVLEQGIASLCIEVKVSRADYLSGYHSPCELNYLLVPEGLVAKDELPAHIGLLYGQAEQFRWGMHLIRRAEWQSPCLLPGPLAAFRIASKLTNEWEYQVAYRVEGAKGIKPGEVKPKHLISPKERREL